MVKLLLAFALAACAATASATDVDTKAPKNPAIKTVVIEKTAAWSDGVSSDESSDSCRDFVLTKSDVREFFRRARPATHTEYVHDLLMSRCYISGRVMLKDGREAAFHIDRARRGRLRFEDMSSWYYFCGKCRRKAYGKSCDIDCINAD